MSRQQLPIVNSESIYIDFQEHICEEFNERILFSAPFGAGKSTFLKNFFDQHEEYITLKLYPVNYSIAPNQDVFELIKYDLLYELLSNFPNEIQLQKEEFSTLLISQMFILHKMKIDFPMKIMLKAAGLVSGSGIPDDDSIDSVIEQFKAFNNYRGAVEESEYDTLNRYIKSSRKRLGHAYERDDISELIINMLDRVKKAKSKGNENKNFETVLLIDDLDRLDPEHVFRLFNVFSAHYDEVNETNKFGFDKIIFVCDVNNIQHMFNHRYGLNVEFGGYIDKFYSSEVFKFDIVRYLKDSILELVKARYDLFKFFSDGLPQTISDRFDFDRNEGFYNIYKYILFKMIDFQLIRVRNFQRFKHYTIPDRRIEAGLTTISAYYYHFLVLSINLEGFFPRPLDLLNVYEVLYKTFISDYEPDINKQNIDRSIDRIVEYSLPFIIDEKRIFTRKFDFESNKDYMLDYLNEKGEPLEITYQLTLNYDYEYVAVKLIKCVLRGKQAPALRPNPFWFLYNAYKNCINKKYLN
ncbi:hypothetical protein EON71_00885 [bacterium]|nr:MAG: hypothetical protein EON71_00885 [bacterium]